MLRSIKSDKSEKDNDIPQIDEKLYNHLHSSSASPATFYGLPKIHKLDVPLRPITSSISFPTYNLSKHLVVILSPLVKGKYTVRNSADFSERIKDLTIAVDEVMVSFDVTSLFTSIPVDLALNITKDKLERDRQLSIRTNISISNILRLLEFVLKNSYFTYKNDYYKQISGCAMGSPISATIANLVLEHVEEVALTTAPNPPRWWFRFVDDSHASLKREYVEEFHKHLNSINEQIQFTVGMEENNKLSFLDTVTTRQDGRIKVDVFRKKTHTDKYLNFTSNHPPQHKRSVVNTLLDRADKIPSTNRGKRKERKHVINVLKDNGYPLEFIRSCENKRRRQNKKLSSQNNENVTQNIAGPSNHIVIPYIKGVSEKISRILQRENIRVSFQPVRTLQQEFPKPKDKLDSNNTRNIVYRINCSACDFSYYGQTNRALKIRIKEHERAVQHRDKNSKIAQHVEKCDHRMDFENVRIVSRVKNYRERLFLEAWYFQVDTNSGNDHVDIPNIYRSLMHSN